VPQGCVECAAKDAEIEKLRRQNEEYRLALRELDKMCTLQERDLKRIEEDRNRRAPNRPEGASGAELQLVFESVVAALGMAVPANEGGAAPDGAASAPASGPDESIPSQPEPRSRTTQPKKRKGHGRRPLDTSKLPVEEIVLPPDEVRANPDAFKLIGCDTVERLAHRKGEFFVLRIVREKYRAIAKEPNTAPSAMDSIPVGSSTAAAEPVPIKILCAPIPGYLWPRTMADTSAITQVILSKYDMCTPLHRQERAYARCGFDLPRSTQCDWLSAAYDQLYRIVDAMMDEATTTAFCIATDATGAPVRAPRECVPWHVFVFIADADHVIFRPARHHSSVTITALLGGFRGHLLSDASLIYDTLHRDRGIIEVACWSHLRRYFWRCRATEPRLALEALSIIGKLFEVERSTKVLAMPGRTQTRAELALPVLDLFDRWIDEHGPVDEGSPFAAAHTYYENQRTGLRTFLTDGRLRIDNNISEGELRNLVLGRHNWMFFENPNGLRWYCVFRSLIASCRLHGLEAQDYLDEVLRLAPHWPVARMLELSPKYWARTRAALSKEHLAIVAPSWRVSPSSIVTPAA
jgi:transposase